MGVDLALQRRNRGIERLRLEHPSPVERPPLHEARIDAPIQALGRELLLEALSYLQPGCLLVIGPLVGADLSDLFRHAPRATVIAADLWPVTTPACVEKLVAPALSPEERIEDFWSSNWSERERLILMKTHSARALLELRRAGVEPDFIYLNTMWNYLEALRDLNLCRSLFPRAWVCPRAGYARLINPNDPMRAINETVALQKIPSRSSGCYGLWPPAQVVSHQLSILSVHIPKTGGTTFLNVLRAAFNDQVEGRYTTEREPVAEGTKVLHGHFRANEYLLTHPSARLATFVREPVQRFVSNYYHCRRPTARDRVATKVKEENLDLRAFAEIQGMRNLQTYFLQDVELEDLDFIGLTEQYERSVKLFCRVFGISKPLTAGRENTNPARARSGYQLDVGLARDLRALNQMDYDLYGQACEVFERLCRQHDV